jgi:hypothetical protein
MKRITLITITFCLLVLLTAGMGAVAMQPLLPPYRVAPFDVTYNGEVVGKLRINTHAWTYVLNVRELAPDTEYWLKCEGVPGVITSGMANLNGVLHLNGKVNPVS